MSIYEHFSYPIDIQYEKMKKRRNLQTTNNQQLTNHPPIETGEKSSIRSKKATFWTIHNILI